LLQEVAEMTPEILATLAGGMFAGAAAYVSLVEHPARLACGVKVALTEWKPSYKRGTAMQASLAVIGSLLAALSWRLDKKTVWLVGGALLFAVVPFTLLVILPTNKKLESAKLDCSSAQTEHHLRLWGKLHAVRSLLSFLAFLIFLIALRHQP
jgi:hypothetical protein